MEHVFRKKTIDKNVKSYKKKLEKHFKNLSAEKNQMTNIGTKIFIFKNDFNLKKRP